MTRGFFRDGSLKTFDNAIASLTNTITESADPSRDDRLWPADATVFQASPLGLSHGALGIAAFLVMLAGVCHLSTLVGSSDRSCPATVIPPGSSSGMAGIAWSLLEIGDASRALELISAAFVPCVRLPRLLRTAYTGSPHRIRRFDLGMGSAVAASRCFS